MGGAGGRGGKGGSGGGAFGTSLTSSRVGALGSPTSNLDQAASYLNQAQAAMQSINGGSAGGDGSSRGNARRLTTAQYHLLEGVMRKKVNHDVPGREGSKTYIESCASPFCDRPGLRCKPVENYQRKFYTCCSKSNWDTLCNEPPCWFRGQRCPDRDGLFPWQRKRVQVREIGRAHV